MRLPLLSLGLLTTLFTALFTALPLLAAPELKGSPDELRNFLEPRQQTVSLYGSSTITAYTDIAEITLVVTSKDKNLSKALQLNEQIRSELRREFVAAGIDRNSIKSAKFSSSAQYGWFGKSPSSYEVVNRIQVSIDDAQHMQVLATASDRREEVRFGGVKFRHSEKETTKAKTRKQALDDVLKQRLLYQKQLGLKLAAVNFHYQPVRLHAARPAMMMSEKSAMAARSEPTFDAPEFEDKNTGFDEVKYEASVQVTFEVRSSN